MTYTARMIPGKGIASRMHARRIGPVEELVGTALHPGTLNLKLDRAFDWGADHTELTIPDAKVWTNLAGEWFRSQVSVYPITVNGIEAWAMRLKRSRAGRHVVEVLAPVMLRDVLSAPVTVEHRPL